MLGRAVRSQATQPESVRKGEKRERKKERKKRHNHHHPRITIAILPSPHITSSSIPPTRSLGLRRKLAKSKGAPKPILLAHGGTFSRLERIANEYPSVLWVSIVEGDKHASVPKISSANPNWTCRPAGRSTKQKINLPVYAQ